jgi:hypothetical protein
LKISNKLSENQTVKVEDLKIKGSIENPNMKVSAKSFNIATIMGEKKWWRTYKSCSKTYFSKVFKIMLV